ncbi:MAG: histidinol-phosphatase, partial [Pseudomonadota bacterium]
AGLNPYDIQAPIAVIQAAGGTITDWTGAPAHDGGTALAAGSATLHQTALTLAAGATA